MCLSVSSRSKGYFCLCLYLLCLSSMICPAWATNRITLPIIDVYDPFLANGSTDPGWTSPVAVDLFGCFDPFKVAIAAGNSGAADGIGDLYQAFGGWGTGDIGLANWRGGNVVVQFDAIMPSDAINVLIGSAPKPYLFATDSLWVRIRRDNNSSGYSTLDIYTSNGEIAGTGNTTWTVLNQGEMGISDNNWHSFAVEFDKDGGRVKVWVDAVQRADLDVTGTVWNEYSTGAISIGQNIQGTSSGCGFFDNFEMGTFVDSSPKVPGDLTKDGYRDIDDFAFLANRWLNTGCGSPTWCDGADFSENTIVDLPDFAQLAGYYEGSPGTPIPNSLPSQIHLRQWKILGPFSATGLDDEVLSDI